MSIPKPTKKRLMQLARLLSQLQNDASITSVRIEELAGWTSATVRKDISHVLTVHPVSSDANGYNRSELLCAINTTLNLTPLSAQSKKKCCIVGLGKIGQALIKSSEFEGSVFELHAGFDISVNRVETLNAPFPLYPLSQLETIIRSEGIKYALLDVDDSDARETALLLAQSGIQGIVNYTATVISVPEATKVENVSVVAALQNVAY